MDSQPSLRRRSDARRDWYSISVDSLRTWIWILGLIAAALFGWKVYQNWQSDALSREAWRAIDDTRILLERIQSTAGQASLSNDVLEAKKDYQRARDHFSHKRFREALNVANDCREHLRNLVGGEGGGATNVARFASVQGRVEFRHGENGEWQDARRNRPLVEGDFVRTDSSGSAEVLFANGTTYTLRPLTQFVVSRLDDGGDGEGSQSIRMDYGWVDLSTSKNRSNIETPGVKAIVREQSEAAVSFDREAGSGRFAALSGGIDLTSAGGLRQSVSALQEVVQQGGRLSTPESLPGRPEPSGPENNAEIDRDRSNRLTLSWTSVSGSGRYALQVSKSHLFVDNLIDREDRAKTQATIGLRGDGVFVWRVAALGKSGRQGPWSDPRTFRIFSNRTASGENDKTPPALDLEDVKSYGTIFIVAGKTEPGCRVTVNGESVEVAADGSFDKAIQIDKEGWSLLVIRSEDRRGNKTDRNQRVFVEGS